MPQSNVVPQSIQQEPKLEADDLQPKIMPQLEDALKSAQCDLALFMQQLHIDRIQLTEAKEKHDREKQENILRYTRLVFLPYGFTDEELYQIEEAVKLLVELNGVTRMEVLSIGKKKGLKQADLKNFCWNIANQYGIDPKTTALFALNLFYAWFRTPNLQAYKRRCATQRAHIQSKLTRTS